MSPCMRNRFVNGIFYPLLLLLLLTCPMKRGIKQALSISVSSVALVEKNNNSFCVKLVSETATTAKQNGKSVQKQLFVSSSSLSVASFAATTAVRQKFYTEKAAGGSTDLFILHQNLLI